MTVDIAPYVLKPALQQFQQQYTSLSDYQTVTVTLTVVPYQNSHVRNNLTVGGTDPTAYGGFKLKNEQGIDGFISNNNSFFTSNANQSIYEFRIDSDLNTMALAMGAKIGDTVRINMIHVFRNDLVYLSDGEKFKNKVLVRYPYKNWDYRIDYSKNNPNLGIGFISYAEDPLDFHEITGTNETYVGGTKDSYIAKAYDGRNRLGERVTTGSYRTYEGYHFPYPGYPGCEDRTYIYTQYDGCRLQHPICGSITGQVLPTKYIWSTNTDNIWNLRYKKPYSEYNYRQSTQNFYYLKNSILFANYVNGQDIDPIYSQGYALNGAGLVKCPDNLKYFSGCADGIFNCPIPYAISPYGTRSVSFQPYEGDINQYVTSPRASDIKEWGGIQQLYISKDLKTRTSSVLVSIAKVSGTTTVFTGSQLVPTLTATPTSTPTPQPTITASATPKVTPTPTRTPTTTKTLTPSVTSTPSTTSTRTPNPTPTRTLNFSTPTASPVNKGLLVQVRDVNNPSYQLTRPEIKNMFPQGIGSVSQPYSIGKYEVTNSEYVEFLNAVGGDNADNIYAFSWIPSSSSGMSVTSKNMVLNKTSSVVGWNEQVYSTAGFTNGAVCSAKASQMGGLIMFGLNSDPTKDSDYTSIDYAWFFAGDGLQIYENGNRVDNFATYSAPYTTSTVLTITYDGSNVKYWQDGMLKRTVARPIGSPLFFDSTFYFQSNSINSVTFGPFSSFNENDAPSFPNRGSIIQSGSPGGYTYSVRPGYENKPVNWVSWNSAARYVNWLYKLKIRAVGSSVNTGVYDLTKNNPTRSADANYWIPSIDEHIKAGYYNPTTGGYYKFGTKSNTAPNAGVGGTDTNGAVYNFTGGGTAQNVGSYPNSTSHYGLNDIVGNVRELTDTFYNNFPVAVNGGAVHPNISTSVFVDIEGINALTTSDAPAVAISMDGSFYGSSLGFRIASNNGLTEAEKISRRTALTTQVLPTPTPNMAQCAYDPNNYVNVTDPRYNNKVCANRFVVQDKPIKNLYGGFLLNDYDDYDVLKAMGVYFATQPGQWASGKIMEFRADSDLNSIALYMGAKPGDKVELQVNNVWRGYELRVRGDGCVDIMPYGSIDPIGGNNFFRTYNITRTYNGPGTLPGKIIKTENVDTKSSYLGISYYPIADGNGGFSHTLPITKYSYSTYDLDPKKAWGIEARNHIDRTLLLYTNSFYHRGYDNNNKEFTIIPREYIKPRSPFSDDPGFSIDRNRSGWEELYKDLLRYSTTYTYGPNKTYQRTFLRYDSNGGTYLLSFDKMLQVIFNEKMGNPQLLQSVENSIKRVLEDSKIDYSLKQNLLEGYYAERDGLLYNNRTPPVGRLSMLVKLTISPPPPPPPSASMTPSSSSIGDVGNLIFVRSPNYSSALKDDAELKQYIQNPNNILMLTSTKDDNNTSGLIPNTRYVIRNIINDRPVIYRDSPEYIIEKWNNNVTTIKFNQPALSSLGNVVIKFNVGNSTSDGSLTVQVLKLKSVTTNFSKEFWSGNSSANYVGNELYKNSVYMKYRGELVNYKFKAYYKTDTMTWDSKIPIGVNPNFTTILELDNFSASVNTQILITSNNLNNDILFPGEGSSKNPNYNPTPLTFQMVIIKRPTEIKVFGANLLSPPSTIGNALQSITPNYGNADAFAISLSKGFNKQIAIVANCFSSSENKTLSSCPIQLQIDNVNGCSSSVIVNEISSFDDIGYDKENPNNVRFKLSIKDPFANKSLYTSSSGSIILSLSTPGSNVYSSSKRIIQINWSIVPSTDSITIGKIDIMYTGDPAKLVSLSLASNNESNPKKKITITPSDSRIMRITQDNSNSDFSITPLAIDVTQADLLTALKNASITISTESNGYYLAVKQTIPIIIYPNNARLSGTPSNKYAYISSGISHFFAVTGNGSLHGWGSDLKGVFAGSTTTTSFGAGNLVKVINHPKGLRWTQIETYGYNVYAIDVEGTLWGWGGNENGSLGVGRDGQINTPTVIAPNIKWKDVACGISHAVGISQEGKVYGWGDGTFLQNGCGSVKGVSVNTNAPKEIVGIGDLTASSFGNAVGVYCGPYSSWIIAQDNILWAFGDLNGLWKVKFTFALPPIKTASYFAPLTHHNTAYSSRRHSKGTDPILFNVPNNVAKKKWNPHKVLNTVGQTIAVKNISASANHVLAIDLSGKVLAWGDNTYKQCFIYAPATYDAVPPGSYVGPELAAKTFSGKDGTFIAASPGQSLLIDINNDFYISGKNDFGELAFISAFAGTSDFLRMFRQIPGKFRSVTANSTGGFAETFL
jgi:formylglycine-generating enzyme required for sulfatase activity/alpha-tubulin suppressor-like RCC1 family protein